MLEQYPGANYTIIRNALNIGGNANILRCFELCETPWLWVLGDDDKVEPAAVATILETIESDPELLWINFATEICPRKTTFVTDGLEQFTQRIDSVGNAIFISACVYNCRKVRPQINHGYQYAYSCAAQLVIVLMSLGNGEKCLFSDKRIVHWEPALTAQEQGPMIVAWIGLQLLALSLHTLFKRNARSVFSCASCITVE